MDFLNLFPLKPLVSNSTQNDLEVLRSTVGTSRVIFFIVSSIYNEQPLSPWSILIDQSPKNLLPDQIISSGVLNIDTQKIEYYISSNEPINPWESDEYTDIYLKHLNKLMDALKRNQ